MGIISVLLFLLLGGLFGPISEPTYEPVTDDPIADEFYSLFSAEAGYCSGYGPGSPWKCVEKKLPTSELVQLDLDDSGDDETFRVLHYVIRPDASVTLYTETWDDETTVWSRTECEPLATIRETVQSCR